MPTTFAQQGFEGTPAASPPQVAVNAAAVASWAISATGGCASTGDCAGPPQLGGRNRSLAHRSDPRQRKAADRSYAGSDRHGCLACPHSGVPTAVVTRREDAASDSDQVEAGERMVNLLHGTAAGEVAEVDHSEACVLEKREGGRLRVVVVARDEYHALTAGLVRV